MKSRIKMGAWLSMGLATLMLLTACGGGGGGGSGAATQPPTQPADARNGEYTAFAADGYPYALNLDFDAMTYSVVGGSVNATGTFVAEGSKYVFLPAPAGAAQNTAKFTIANDTVIAASSSAPTSPLSSRHASSSPAWPTRRGHTTSSPPW